VGSLLKILLQISNWVHRWKNCENRSIFSKDMDKNIMSPFFWLTVYLVIMCTFVLTRPVTVLWHVVGAWFIIRRLRSRLHAKRQARQWPEEVECSGKTDQSGGRHWTRSSAGRHRRRCRWQRVAGQQSGVVVQKPFHGLAGVSEGAKLWVCEVRYLWPSFEAAEWINYHHVESLHLEAHWRVSGGTYKTRASSKYSHLQRSFTLSAVLYVVACHFCDVYLNILFFEKWNEWLKQNIQGNCT